MSKIRKPRIEYDKSWKEVVTHLTKPFIEFFLSDLYEQIDWNIPPEFLEKELHNAKNIKKSKRIVDKLIKVQLKNGEEKWIFIHIEFQTDSNKIIGLRMYEYYQLIRERYGKEIVALAIYTGISVPKEPNFYTQEYFGTSITYKFNSYEVINQKEEELLANDNPFALVVLANLYLLQTQNDDVMRYNLKKKVYELGGNKGYSIDYLANLLIFVTELMKLPFELEEKFKREVIFTSSKTNNMYKNLNQSSIAVVNVMVEMAFGENILAIKAEAQKEKEKAEKEKAEKEKEKAEKEKIKVALKQMGENFSKSVVLLYQGVGMPIEDIAEHLGMSTDVIRQALINNNVSIA